MSVSLPALPMPPPLAAEPPVIVMPWRIAVPPLTWMTWNWPPPLMVTTPPPGPWISTGTTPLGRASVLARVIVCGAAKVPDVSKLIVLGAGFAMFSGLSLVLPAAQATPERSVPAVVTTSDVAVTR